MSWRKGAEEMVLKSLWKWGWSDSAPVAESFLVFTSNPPGTSCHSSLSSLFAPVPPSHLFVSHAVLRLSLFCSLLLAASVCLFLFFFFFLNLISILSSRPSLSALDSHSSSVSSRLPENFTIALNDTWVSFDSSSSPDKKKKKRRLFCLPQKTSYKNTVLIAACLCSMILSYVEDSGSWACRCFEAVMAGCVHLCAFQKVARNYEG